MRNTRKSGQILRSKKRPRPTLRSGRGSRTNSNTSYQIPARVIEADKVNVHPVCDVLLVVSQSHSLRSKPGERFMRMPETLRYSVVAAVQTFWLAARAEGLGVGWISILEPKIVCRMLDVPEAWTLVAYLCVGQPAEDHLDPELERHGWQQRLDAERTIFRR